MPTLPPAEGPAAAPLREVALLALRLGATAFGGPAAHIAMLRDEVVTRRQWMTDHAFLDMLAWSEGTDNGRQKTRNHGYDVIVGGELFTDYSDHPRKLVTLNPKLKSTGAGRYQLLSRWWDAYRKQLGLKDFSPKSQDAVALQQIKERGALPMIDRGDIRQAIDRCSNIWASLPGAGYGQFEHKADSLIAKFKEAGGTVREIDV